MTPLEPAIIPQEQRDKAIASLVDAWNAGEEKIRAAFPAADDATALMLINSYVDHEMGGDVFMNDSYQVLARPTKMFNAVGVWLSIKRIDKEPIHDWRDLQEIKNQMVGAECEAIELYPAESRRVDNANQFHLWCLADPAVRFPVGFPVRVVDQTTFNGSKQRPL